MLIAITMDKYYVAALKRLAFLVVFFTLCRLFFLLFNGHYFLMGDDVRLWEIVNAFLSGIRFDISIILYLNSLFILLVFLPLPLQRFRFVRSLTQWSFYLPNILALLVNLTDTVYFRFTGKRTTADVIAFLEQGGGFTNLLGDFLTGFLPELITGIALLAVFIYIISKKAAWPKSTFPFHLRNFVTAFIVSVLIGGGWIIGARGGLQLKPINIIDALKNNSPKYAALALNTPFTIGKTLGKAPLKKLSYYPEEVLNKIYNPIHLPDSQSTFNDSINIVILIVESLSAEHCGFMTPRDTPSFTPFLDSLSRKSMVFRAFANGKRSIEGIPAVLASLPSLMHQEFITSPYAGNKIEGLGSLLAAEGYETAFFHGGKNGTMGFEAFTSAAGFEHYYGLDEYPDKNDYDGKWGIFDEPYLQYVCKSLNSFQQPFLASIFTLSSHHPYTIPTQYEGKFPKGRLQIQETIAYADYALRKFFETAQKSPWFANTLFVITADHTSEALDPYYQNRIGRYEIPLLFYMPAKIKAQRKKGIAQQSDIMPTVLNILNYPKPYLSFGRNLTDSTANYAFNYVNGTYQLLSDEYSYISQGDEAIGLYNRKADSLMRDNLLNKKLLVQEQYDSLLKAVIQQYNNRMIDNKMRYQP